MSPAGGGQGLSVVLVAWHGASALEDALQALAAEPGISSVDVVVVHSPRLVPRRSPAAALAGARQVVPASDWTVPALRAAGIEAARGARVVLLEDHCPVRAGWLRAHQAASGLTPAVVLAGAVEPAPQGTSLEWAVWYQDYAPHARCRPPGPTPDPTGCHVSLPRAVVVQLSPFLDQGVHEGSLGARLRELGIPVRFVPDMAVEHRGRYRPAWALTQSWHHGRAFGAGVGQVSRRSLGWRWCRLAATPLLLVLLPIRTLWRYGRLRPRGDRGGVGAVFWLVGLWAAWLLGESAGIVGGAGGSASEWG